MRTTLSIDDDVLEAVKRHAAGRSVSLGEAASELLRRALRAECPTADVNGLRVFDPGPASALVRAEAIERLLDEELR